MRLRDSRIWLTVVSFLLVLGLFIQDLESVSPGPLTRTHVQDQKLLESGSCELCHGNKRQTMAQACGECHAAIAEDLEAGTGLHGTMDGVDARDCALCHKEHHGAGFELTSQASFVMAGIADRNDYDHEDLDFTLKGRHLDLGCVDCHELANVELLGKGQTRFHGLDKNCEACHEDVHEGRITRDCASCHGQEHPFEEVHAFAHAEFRQVGAHAVADCAACHAVESDYSVETLAGPGPVPLERACAACHDSPHSKSFLSGVAGQVSTVVGESCALCHEAVHESFAGQDQAMPRDLHAAVGLALASPHAEAACEDCHGKHDNAAGGTFTDRFRGRDARDCAVCHDDPHAGQFADESVAPGCLTCHDEHSFLPPLFDLEHHEATGFPLEESHQAVACSACHLRSEGEHSPRVFRGTPRRCEACHVDVHAASIVGSSTNWGSHAELGSGCEECHLPSRFAEVEEERFDHGLWTGFALTGAHSKADCESCHTPSGQPDEAGRRFGRVAELFPGPADRCETCHADVHEGSFDNPSLPQDVDGREGCLRCHATYSFSIPLPGVFDHGKWTGYNLDGAHVELTCESCHAPTVAPDANGRRFGRALGSTCGACHADPHVGQFERQGKTDCARCHVGTEGLAFNHQRDTRFQLDKTHRKLDCSTCHVPWQVAGGQTAVRYKPLGTQCGDCHLPEKEARSKGR